MASMITRRGDWAGMLAGPLAWLVDELAAIAITYDFCSGRGAAIGGGPALALLAIGVAAFLAALMGGLTAWRHLNHPIDSRAGDDTVRDRLLFMARFGVVISSLSAVAILFRTITVLFLSGYACS
jgi:hypothetical protein